MGSSVYYNPNAAAKAGTAHRRRPSRTSQLGISVRAGTTATCPTSRSTVSVQSSGIKNCRPSPSGKNTWSFDQGLANSQEHEPDPVPLVGRPKNRVLTVGIGRSRRRKMVPCRKRLSGCARPGACGTGHYFAPGAAGHPCRPGGVHLGILFWPANPEIRWGQRNSLDRSKDRSLSSFQDDSVPSPLSEENVNLNSSGAAVYTAHKRLRSFLRLVKGVVDRGSSVAVTYIVGCQGSCRSTGLRRAGTKGLRS
jgi:hypothetical protein